MKVLQREFEIGDLVDYSAMELLFEPVVVRDNDLTQRINDTIVEAWEVSDDGLTYRVRFRAGLMWHDDEPWTARDVRFSWEAILDDQVRALSWKSPAAQLDDVRVVDDRTVEYVHKSVLATALANMSWPVIPEHVYGKAAERDADPTLMFSDYYMHHNRAEIVGNGAYRLVEWNPVDKLVVERWPGYAGEPARFARQILKRQDDFNMALMMLLSGEVADTGLSAQQFATQTSTAQFEAVANKAYYPSLGVAVVAWNVNGSNPFFTDIRVRRAMALAFDHEKLLALISYGLYTKPNGIFPPSHWAHNPDIVPYPYDLGRAGELLDEAGWRTDADDGYRYKEIDGEKVRFEFEVTIGKGSNLGTIPAAVFAESLGKLGVIMHQRYYEVGTMVALWKEYDFQARFSYANETRDPDFLSIGFETGAYEWGQNYGGYSNPRVDELFEKGRRTLDREARVPIYQEIQRLLYEDQARLYMWNGAVLWAFSKDVAGVEMSPLGPARLRPGWRSWWLPAKCW